ncbi:MAG: class I SAM-dependent methyltransferase [Spirochaetales bacterium]|nr:class I SAM-dependent methyltransferase [Spirochaetales bacterium]
MNEKIVINIGSVQKTLLLPLWGRAVESKKENPRLIDRKAVEIIERIDYDFSVIAKNISFISQMAWVARSLHIDNVIRGFIQRNPDGAVVNIGCGLDTTYERMNNDGPFFYDLDLPDVTDLRENFFRDSKKRKTISCSFLETDWFRQIEKKGSVLFVAAGVFYYFSESELKKFLISLADHFVSCEMFFDAASPLGVRTANEKVLKSGGMDAGAMLSWGIKSGKEIESWDDRITLLDEFPMFRGFRKSYPFKIRYGLWLSDVLKIMSMVHLRIGG